MLPGIRQLARTRVAELARGGLGADRIYRTVREEFGPGYARSAIRADVVPFRSWEYLQRYSFAFRRPIDIRMIFQERSITSSQRGEWLWELSFKSGTQDQFDEQFMSITTNDLLSDDDAIRRAQELAEFNRYADVFDFQIVGRWHRTL